LINIILIGNKLSTIFILRIISDDGCSNDATDILEEEGEDKEEEEEKEEDPGAGK
jgi:hypothetical protein